MEKYKFSCMGTKIEIIFVVPGENNKTNKQFNTKTLIDDIQEECKRYEQKFSVFESSSVVTKINNFKEIYIDEETKSLLDKSIYLAEISKGAFDFTVYPLLEAWGFYDEERFSKIPNKRNIKSNLQYVGYNNIKLFPKKNFIKKKYNQTKIDFSGIAKGFLVDRIIDMLKLRGIKQALVNAGGDMYCLGKAPDGKFWGIGIQHPKFDNKIIGKVELSDMAIVTSGDYENFFILDDVKYSHIINPITGYPVKNKLVSVTVIASDTVIADGLATAIMVMGQRKGLKLVDDLKNVEAITISEIEDKMKLNLSSGLKNGKFNFAKR